MRTMANNAFEQMLRFFRFRFRFEHFFFRLIFTALTVRQSLNKRKGSKGMVLKINRLNKPKRKRETKQQQQQHSEQDKNGINAKWKPSQCRFFVFNVRKRFAKTALNPLLCDSSLFGFQLFVICICVSEDNKQTFHINDTRPFSERLN